MPQKQSDLRVPRAIWGGGLRKGALLAFPIETFDILGGNP